MEIKIQDKSNYLRSILILIGKDGKIGKAERQMVLKLSHILGFSKSFCEEAVNDLLENEYIIDDPPLFSDKEIAEAFLKDGIRIAFADKGIHLYEMNWLKAVGDKNNISPEWQLSEFEKIQKSTSAKTSEKQFEIAKLLR
ncbi:MAG: hypothetical protein M1495_15655 [Bacteroidetes bacterium]|nr:hypothetical protein [Bacteroidota bacterium]MCL6098006.1 hypothetical protein [Bacteroidota bacterium]